MKLFRARYSVFFQFQLFTIKWKEIFVIFTTVSHYIYTYETDDKNLEHRKLTSITGVNYLFTSRINFFTASDRSPFYPRNQERNLTHNFANSINDSRCRTKSASADQRPNVHLVLNI